MPGCAHSVAAPAARSCARAVNARHGSSFPASLALLFRAKQGLKNQIPANKNPFLSNVLGPQYVLNADGSYSNAGAVAPVDVIGGRKMLRTCGAVQNLLPSGAQGFVTGWSTGQPIVVTQEGDWYKITASSAGMPIHSITTAVPATVVTASIEVKKGAGVGVANNFILRDQTAGVNLIVFNFNYDTGVISYSIGSSGATAVQLPNGGWKLVIVYSSWTSGNQLRFYVGYTGGATVTGDHLFARNPQLTASAYPLPYTPPGTTMPASHATTTNGPWFGLPQYDDAETADGLFKRDGVELVVNGDFSNGTTGWSSASGGILDANTGTLCITGAAGDATYAAAQTITLSVGSMYRVKWNASGTAANKDLRIGTTPAGTEMLVLSGDGTKETTITATSTTGYLTLYGLTADKSACFDNISIQKLIPATKTNPVWAALDGEPDGVELVTNGADREFSSDTGYWTKGTWVIGSGVLTGVANSTATKDSLVTVGQRYMVAFDVVSRSAGQFRVLVGNSAATSWRSSVGRFSEIVTCAGNTQLILQGDASWAGSIDNISIQRIQPKPMTLAWRGVMGVGSGDLAVGNNQVLGCNTSVSLQFFASDPSMVRAYDGATQTPVLSVAWTRNASIIRFTQVNTAGTQFRVGYLIEGTHTTIQWSAWATFDGSFNPSTLYKLMLGFSNIYPMWHDTIALWSKQIDDATLLKEMLK